MNHKKKGYSILLRFHNDEEIESKIKIIAREENLSKSDLLRKICYKYIDKRFDNLEKKDFLRKYVHRGNNYFRFINVWLVVMIICLSFSILNLNTFLATLYALASGCPIGVLVIMTYNKHKYNLNKPETFVEKANRKLLKPDEIIPSGLLDEIKTPYGIVYRRNKSYRKSNTKLQIKMPEGIKDTIIHNRRMVAFFEC